MENKPPDGNDELPDDEITPDQYQAAAEVTLQRLIAYLKTFSDQMPPQATHGAMTDPNLAPGALYTIPGSEPGTFQVIKVLALDDLGVHVRLYGNAFSQRPAQLAPDLLDMAPFLSLAPEDIGYEWPLSVGHLPLLADTFASLQPVFVLRVELEEEELDDYSEWVAAGGGYL